MRTKIILLAGLLLVLTVTHTHATMGRDNLMGLRGIFVTVEEVRPDLEKDGVTQAQLQTRVELKLRQAGIRVLTQDEWFKALAFPRLYLRITSVHDRSDPFYAAFVSLQFMEVVKLTHDRLMPSANAIIWEQGRVLIVGTARLRTIYDTVDDLMDEFINDYLAANPK